MRSPLKATGLDPRLALARGVGLSEAIRQNTPALESASTTWIRKTNLDADLAGYGPILAPLVQDETVTDVLVNSPTQAWVDRGDGLEPCQLDLDDTQLRTLAITLAAAAGQRLDDASPIVDGTLPDGTRLHAVLPPLAASALISLRTSRRCAMTVTDLINCGTIAPAIAELMEALIAARASTFISGATGSGKTTLLAALLSLVSPTERILCIEEVTELRPNHPHVVSLQQRRANVQAVGEITISDLLKAAMRMRPDRLVLGECRGGEVRDVLSAMNTGHEGGWATIHANTAADVPARLCALGALAHMDPPTVAAQAAAGIDAIIHIRRAVGGVGPTRWISQIAVPKIVETQLLAAVAVDIDRSGNLQYGPAWPILARRLGLSGERYL